MGTQGGNGGPWRWGSQAEGGAPAAAEKAIAVLDPPGSLTGRPHGSFVKLAGIGGGGVPGNRGQRHYRQGPATVELAFSTHRCITQAFTSKGPGAHLAFWRSRHS